jgi:hypothetical protein
MHLVADISRFTSLNLNRTLAKRNLSRLFIFIAWTSVFALIYAQSPLYTSNQNQYFLHGLAQADFGFLKNDWLANTLDPTPLFSLMVGLTYSIFQTGILFHFYYAILLGIYLFSLLGIGSRLYDLSHPTARLVFLASLLAIHSAALRFVLSRSIGYDQSFILEGGLAGQRTLGLVFQPSTFGVLLVLSIYLFLIRRTFLALLPLAMAVSFHPTYLLSSGIIILSYVVETYRDERDLVKSGSIGVLALLLVSPILFYVFRSFGSTPAETTAQARDILVYFRIPHHAVISEWFEHTSIVQIAFILIALYLLRGTRLFTVMLVSFLCAALLTLVQEATQNEALALLFPWRISAILVPLSVSILAAALVRTGFNRFPSLMNEHRPAITYACLILISMVTLVGVTRMVLERQIAQSSDERALMRYVKAEKQPADVYLIPVKMQDFRLATGAPVYVDFKSIPYQDAEVLEWYRRLQLATGFYDRANIDCELVAVFAAEGVTHIALSSENVRGQCGSLRLEYQDEHYGVFSISR